MTPDSPIDLRSLTLPRLAGLVQEMGLPPFRARQIFSWIHGRGVTSTEPMTNLSRELRQRLTEAGTLEPLQVEAELTASDGTRKLRLRCRDGAAIETVLIPEEEKLTQCLSTQVGCGLGCRFCATATMGLKRNLTPGEIVDQVYRARELVGRGGPSGFTPLGGTAVKAVPSEGPQRIHSAGGDSCQSCAKREGERISNLVFMGMGEPMNNLDHVLAATEILCSDQGANFSPRRITISTAGVVPGIEEMGRRAPQVGLAVSLNATTDELRSELMPVNRRWPLPVLMKALRDYPLPRRRRITFEYVLLAGLNDTAADARRLPSLLNGIPCKVNLIPWNCSRPDAPYRRPTEEGVERFAERLRDKDLPTYLRRSRGEEIAAACGQLVAGAHSVE